VVLFLGYNLADPDFKLLWRELLDRMGRFALGAWAIAPGLPADERRVWESARCGLWKSGFVPFLDQLAAL